MFSEVHGFSDWKNVLPLLLFCETICRYSQLYCWSGSRKRYSETNSTELFPQKLTGPQEVEKFPEL